MRYSAFCVETHCAAKNHRAGEEHEVVRRGKDLGTTDWTGNKDRIWEDQGRNGRQVGKKHGKN